MAGMLARVLMQNSAGLYPPMRSTGTRRTSRKRKAASKRQRTSSARKNKKARTRTTRKARLIKGSAAARRYMAKIRKMRRR